MWSEAMYSFREAWMLTSRLTGWMLSLCSRTGWTSACTDWSTWVERSEVSEVTSGPRPVSLLLDLKDHLLRRPRGRARRLTALRCGIVRDVGVEQGFNVVNEGVFKVNSGRLELEGHLRREHTLNDYAAVIFV